MEGSEGALIDIGESRELASAYATKAPQSPWNNIGARNASVPQMIHVREIGFIRCRN